MNSLPSIAVVPGIDITPSADDPLVVRRADITRELLREGIRRLSQLERDALRLATREQLNVADAADRLAVGQELVEEALRSGLLSLRRSLLEQLGAPDQ